MDGFTPARARDAWATIRGYVYQVDLTIFRWLDLRPGQMLELERGEDIDHVSSVLQNPTDNPTWLLEQVKHRDTPLTLRTPSALNALACAVEHLQSNAGIALFFRYSTNAQIRCEKPPLLPNNIPGVTAWQQLRSRTWDIPRQEETLQAFLSYLERAKQPGDLADETWTLFQTYVKSASADQFLEFIDTFEWSTGLADLPQLREQIYQRLLSEKIAESEPLAEEIYQRLFLHVLKLLCQRGPKQLTVEDRAALFALPTISEADRQLRQTVWRHIGNLEQRVAKLEQQVRKHSQEIARLDSQVRQLARDQEVDAAITYTLSKPLLDIPPLVDHASQRSDTISSLSPIVQQHSWTALVGSAGSGKTQLAVLIAQALGTCRAWIRFRDLTTAQAAMRLDEACAVLTGSPPPLNRRDWYSDLCRQVGQGTLLVLDDIPRLANGDELAERIVQLALTCQAFGVRLLSTSSFPLPLSISNSLSEKALYTVDTPPLSNSEVGEILQALGAPSTLLNLTFLSFINILSKKHPLLLRGIASYLERHGWQVNDDTLKGLFGEQYTAKINRETLNRLLDTVDDTENRELLSRLSLLPGTFALAEVQALATIDPVIVRPRERINRLVGLWVQLDDQDQFTLSPLLQVLGTGDVLPQTQKDCHHLLGERIIQGRRLTPLQMFRALNHFVAAEEFDRSGSLLIIALNDLNKLDPQVPDQGILSVWAERPLPEQMRLGIRIYLRGLQIAAYRHRNLDATYLVQDLDSLLEQATGTEAWAVLGVAAFAPVDFIHACSYLSTALTLLPEGKMPSGDPLVLPEDLQPEVLIWAHITEMTTHDHLRNWLTIIESLTPEQRRRAFTAAPAEQGCRVLTDWIWLSEREKPQEQQQWQTVLAILQELENRAQQPELELLRAWATRALIIVQAEEFHNLAGAIYLATAALASAPSDPRIHFLLKATLGQEYLFAQQDEEALNWLSQAMAQETTSYPFERFQAFVNLSRAISSQDPQAAIGYTRQAVDVASTVGIFESVQACCELALALWFADDRPASFAAWDQAAEQLLACREDTARWKGLFVQYGHVSGYLYHVVVSGQPPDHLSDGKPYKAPSRGMFLAPWIQVAARYDHKQECFLMAQLAAFAEAVGNDERASFWASHGIDLARIHNQPLALASLGTTLIPVLVRSDRYAEALDLALELGPIQVAAPLQDQIGGDPHQLDIDQLLGAKPNNQWQEAERISANRGLLPICFHLGTLALNEPDRAMTQAAEVASLCRQISSTAVDSWLWTTAAELIEHTYIQKAPPKELKQRSDSFDVDRYSLLRLIGYLGVTLQDGISPQEALFAHNTILPVVYRAVPPSTLTYQKIIVPFVAAYWALVFERHRKLFNRPLQVERGLRAVESLPPDQKVQSILNTIAVSLGYGQIATF